MWSEPAGDDTNVYSVVIYFSFNYTCTYTTLSGVQSLSFGRNSVDPPTDGHGVWWRSTPTEAVHETRVSVSVRVTVL